MTVEDFFCGRELLPSIHNRGFVGERRYKFLDRIGCLLADDDVGRPTGGAVWAA